MKIFQLLYLTIALNVLVIALLHGQSVSIIPSSNTTTIVNTEYWIEVEVGGNNPAEDVFGISLKLHVDNSNTEYVEGSAEAGGFLGDELIEFFQKVDDQTVDMAVSKTSGEGASGTGTVIRAKFKSMEVGSVNFTLLDIEVLDSEGNSIQTETNQLLVQVIMVQDTVSIEPVALFSQKLETEYWIEVEMGKSNLAEDVFGVSLKLHVDDSNTKYVEESAEAGGFLGDEIIEFFQKVDDQTVDMAVSKTSGEGVSGNGIAMRAKFISSMEGQISFSLLNIEMLDSKGNSINTTTDSLLISIKIITSSDENDEFPNTPYLHQNYPNPFNPSTNIQFSLPKASLVELNVFDLTGRHVAHLFSGRKAGGNHTVAFNASNLSSGIYIYRIKAGDFVETKRMMLIK